MLLFEVEFVAFLGGIRLGGRCTYLANHLLSIPYITPPLVVRHLSIAVSESPVIPPIYKLKTGLLRKGLRTRVRMCRVSLSTAFPARIIAIPIYDVIGEIED